MTQGGCFQTTTFLLLLAMAFYYLLNTRSHILEIKRELQETKEFIRQEGQALRIEMKTTYTTNHARRERMET